MCAFLMRAVSYPDLVKKQIYMYMSLQNMHETLCAFLLEKVELVLWRIFCKATYLAFSNQL